MDDDSPVLAVELVGGPLDGEIHFCDATEGPALLVAYRKPGAKYMQMYECREIVTPEGIEEFRYFYKGPARKRRKKKNP